MLTVFGTRFSDDEEEGGEEYVQKYSPSSIETLADGAMGSDDMNGGEFDDWFGARGRAFVERHLPARKEGTYGGCFIITR